VSLSEEGGAFRGLLCRRPPSGSISTNTWLVEWTVSLYHHALLINHMSSQKVASKATWEISTTMSDKELGDAFILLV
jgi:hypothetical protein